MFEKMSYEGLCKMLYDFFVTFFYKSNDNDLKNSYHVGKINIIIEPEHDKANKITYTPSEDSRSD